MISYFDEGRYVDCCSVRWTLLCGAEIESASYSAGAMEAEGDRQSL